MIDLKVLESKGVSSDKLKKLFTSDKEKWPQELKDWSDRLRIRIHEGLNYNIANYKTYHALDVAWDTPFRQVSPTLLGSLLNKDVDSKEVLSLVKEWGLETLMVPREVVDPKTNRPKKVIDAPAFFQILVPLVRAYVTIRWAKIMNDRRLVPFFKYEPGKDTAINRLKCEVITDRVQKMSTQFGYYDAVKQAVFQMLHYSYCLQFPVEEWYEEKQDNYDKDKQIKTVITKEGLRYHEPHPTRMFHDQAFKLSSFNTDTGCSFAGYWRVRRFKEIKSQSNYWNTDKITIGATDWFNTSPNFFATVYSACTMKFPQSYEPSGGGAGGAFDREAVLASGVYNGNLDDAAVTLTEYFEKLVPKECGMGDYDKPVWFRFVVASDNTVVYAAPLPYCPVIYYGYDAHEARHQNASLSLEIIPFQDQISNLLSQVILSAKQNLTNVNFVDTDQVDEPEIQRLENLGEKVFRSLNFFRFSSRKWRANQNQVEKAVTSMRFQQLDTNSLITAMKTILDILERVLVMSSQEIAQAASHEQTREEVRNIQQATSSRMTFTSTPVDIAREAMKAQIYQALMAYGDEETYAQVSDGTMTAVPEKALEQLGFTVDEKPTQPGGKTLVKAKAKTAIALEEFASTRDGDDRIDNVAGATAISNFMATILQNPMMEAAIGAEQAISIFNLIAQLAGFPRDFKLVPQPVPPEAQAQQAQQMKQQLLQLCQQVVAQAQQQQGQQVMQAIQGAQQQVMQEVQKALVPIAQTIKGLTGHAEQQDAMIQQDHLALQKITELMESLHVPAPEPPGMPSVPPTQPNPNDTVIPQPAPAG